MPYKHIMVFFCMLLSVNLLLSCASETSNRHITSSYYKIGKPYQINGKWYYPKEENKYDQTGTASWYGPTFHGGKTANGDVFDEEALTAAHRTLPLPSLVRVTNLDNNKSVIVMINDRGPFAKDRIIDVSKRAAEILGFKNRGTTKVRVQYLPGQTDKLLASLPDSMHLKKQELLSTYAPASVEATASLENKAPLVGSLNVSESAPSALESNRNIVTSSAATEEQFILPNPLTGGPYIQAGTFGNKINAERVQSSLQSIGAVNISEVVVNGQPLYRVRIGPMEDNNTAQHALQQVVGLGHPDAIVVAD